MNPSTLQFLNTLSRNNNRDWFNDNKQLYVLAKEEILIMVEKLIEEVAQFDEDILKIDPKKALFRIYRDTRFSKDKTPYKTHFGIGLGMSKIKKISGYYLHIEPGKSFLAGGVFQPEPSILKEIRHEISTQSEDFTRIIDDENFRNNFRGLSTESKLKRIPSGFDKEDPMGEYLKLKNFIVTHPISDEQVLAKNAVQYMSEIFRTIKPLNDFIERPFL